MKQEFLDKMKSYLSESDFNKLLKAYEEVPSRSIRLNKIKPEIFFKNLPLNVEKIVYDIDGYYLNDEEKYGNHPYHHLGAFYFQEPSAMAPVNMYEFKGNEKVLDLCAAPGGKSSQIARRIPNGILFSNEPSTKRSKILFSNIERLGYSNVVITNEYPQALSKKLSGFFDVIMVDAPCSGEGMMRKDIDAQNQWSNSLVEECAKRDREILVEADKMLKKDGVLIYSTCTFSKEEDEDIIKYIVEELGYEVLPANPKIKTSTKEGYIKETLKFYPFSGRGEGQFMAVLKKTRASLETYKETKNKPSQDIKVVKDFLSENLIKTDDLSITQIGNRFYATATDIDLTGIKVVSNGVELGEVINKRFQPYHHLFKALGSRFKNIVKLDVSDVRVKHYIRGEEIEFETRNGWGVIEIDGLYLGGFKATNNRLKNHYPKGLRNMNLIEH